jgi:hypothetical protein
MRWLCVVMLLLTVTAHAEERRPLTVLAIEPKDEAIAKSADAVTRVIRTQASAKKSEYRLQGKPKEIETATLAAECSPGQARCAAKLGAALGAEVVITGELERRGTHQVLTLALVDVKSKQRIRSVHQSGSDAKKLAKAAYIRLVGGDTGNLAIAANAQRGEVLIDGEIVAALFEGKTTITGLIKGAHRLSIHAKGFRPLDMDVDITADTKQMLLLEPE